VHIIIIIIINSLYYASYVVIAMMIGIGQYNEQPRHRLDCWMLVQRDEKLEFQMQF